MLTSTNISKAYGERLILDNISLSLDSSQSAVIIGRNGVGKSTLLSILAGYLKADSGEINYNGQKVGYIPQQDNLFDNLTVKDNLTFWAKASKSNINVFIEIFGIESYMNKKVKNISGGMKKSVSICCGLSHDPNILIMDEPFSGLDIFYKNNLIKTLEKLKTMGKLILYTSHNIDEIIGLDSTVYTLIDTKLKNRGESGKLLLDKNLMESLRLG